MRTRMPGADISPLCRSAAGSIRRLAAIIILAFCSLSLLAQGTIRFNNRVAGQVDAPIFLPGSATDGVGSWWKVQLFLVTGTGASTSYLPLYPSTAFNDARINPLLTRYVVEPKEPVIVPGVPPGAQATVVMRASLFYYTASGERNFEGQSAPVTITLGGPLPSGEVLPPAPLVGLQGFSILGSPPMFYGLTRNSDQLLFSIYPFQNVSYALESSTDFVNWNPVLTNQTARSISIPFQSSTPGPVLFRFRSE